MHNKNNLIEQEKAVHAEAVLKVLGAALRKEYELDPPPMSRRLDDLLAQLAAQ